MNGKTIRDALQREGRTMVDLAAFLGITPQNINNILTKDNIKSGMVEAVAQFLGKPMSYFYGEAEPEAEGDPQLRVPLVPVEAHAGSLVGFSESIADYDCETIVSPVRGASFAIQVTGESMAPAYPASCVENRPISGHLAGWPPIGRRGWPPSCRNRRGRRRWRSAAGHPPACRS